MNILGKFEEFLNDFKDINFDEFIINLIVASLVLYGLKSFYIRFGNSLSNRKRFAANFLPLGLTTMLIITIVKSSIALSLGLVGALSIVRFRAAIKDPEELTYLFLVIGVGLTTGANQPILAVLASAAILIMLFIDKRVEGRVRFKSQDKLYVNITTDINDLNRISKILKDNFSYVELKRLDTIGSGLDIAYICKAKDIEQINAVRDSVTKISPLTTLSIIDQPDLIV